MNHGHWDTLVPYFLRSVRTPDYKRQKIEIPDGDFLDLDWIQRGQQSLAIVCHGLEGSSQSYYIKGLVPKLLELDCDVLAWNHRSCGGQMNRLPIFYHSGASADLSLVIEHVLKNFDYRQIFLIGYSMGGNILLKYLGEKGEAVSSRITAALAISAPIDLKSSAYKLARGFGRVYSKHLISLLQNKVKKKLHFYQDGKFDLLKIMNASDFLSIDQHLTAPLHGFKDAEDYWYQSSAVRVLDRVRVPAIVLNATNDPFLGEGCFVTGESGENPNVRLLNPNRGGHVGFRFSGGRYFHDEVARWLINKNRGDSPRFLINNPALMNEILET